MVPVSLARLNFFYVGNPQFMSLNKPRVLPFEDLCALSKTNPRQAKWQTKE